MARREYLAGVKTKGFLIGLFMTPFLVGAMLIVPYFLERSVPQKPKNLAVVDLSGQIYPELQSRIDERNQSAKRKYILQEWKIEQDNIDKVKERLNAEVDAGKLHAYVKS